MMTQCRELILPRQPENGGIVGAVEQFVRAARADEMVGILLQHMSDRAHQACGAELRAKLKHYSNSTARKAVELPLTGPNPKRVSRWLETSEPHISHVFSPLSERGPPRP